MNILSNWIVRENLQVVGIYQTRFDAMSAALDRTTGEIHVKVLSDYGFDIYWLDTNIIQIRRDKS